MKLDLDRLKEMKLDLNRLKERFTKEELALGLSLVVLFVLVIALLGVRAGAAKALDGSRAAEKEFKTLAVQYVSLKGEMDELRKRASLGPKEGIIKAVDDLFSSMGLKDKVSTIKPTGTKPLGEMVLEEAELGIRNVDLNEAVNILYRIENGPVLLTVKEAAIKSSFSGPQLDMELRLALVRKK